MSERFEVFMKVWQDRPTKERFRQAVRILSEYAAAHPDKMLDDAVGKLSEQLEYRARTGGYKIDVIELFSKTFDMGHALGVACSAELTKDPNATPILFISGCYEQIIAQDRAEIARLKRWKRAWRRLKGSK